MINLGFTCISGCVNWNNEKRFVEGVPQEIQKKKDMKSNSLNKMVSMFLKYQGRDLQIFFVKKR